jgi:hypothetical protein
MEVQMKGSGYNDAAYPCIVQYILFPPHVVIGPGSIDKDNISEEETDEGCYNFFIVIIYTYMYRLNNNWMTH